MWIAGDKLPLSRKKLLKRHRSFRRKKPKTWCQVYILRDFTGGPIRYVGQTRLAPSERLRWHIKETADRVRLKLGLSPVRQWLAALPSPPIIEVIDPEGVWDISEAVWIDRLRAAGEPLLNVMSVVR